MSSFSRLKFLPLIFSLLFSSTPLLADDLSDKERIKNLDFVLDYRIDREKLSRINALLSGRFERENFVKAGKKFTYFSLSMISLAASVYAICQTASIFPDASIISLFNGIFFSFLSNSYFYDYAAVDENYEKGTQRKFLRNLKEVNTNFIENLGRELSQEGIILSDYQNPFMKSTTSGLKKILTQANPSITLTVQLQGKIAPVDVLVSPTFLSRKQAGTGEIREIKLHFSLSEKSISRFKEEGNLSIGDLELIFSKLKKISGCSFVFV